MGSETDYNKAVIKTYNDGINIELKRAKKIEKKLKKLERDLEITWETINEYRDDIKRFKRYMD